MSPNELASGIEYRLVASDGCRADLLGAFPDRLRLDFQLQILRCIGAVSPIIEIYDGDCIQDQDGRSSGSNVLRRLPFEWCGDDYVTENYSLSLDLSAYEGLHYYSVILDTALGRLRISYNPDSYRAKVTYASEPYEAFQLLVYSSDFRTPDWFKGGIMYQIFVDRFRRAGNVPVRQDAILNEDWDNGIPQYPPYVGAPLENNMFFGGTLYGVAEKLDYLASLGVNTIYLSPVFEAYSNHKYDTGDYLKVDEMFGSEEALRLLISKARKKGIRIILDGVFNHTGVDSRYFDKYGRYGGNGAYSSKESPYYRWYDFYSYPDEYRSWWGIDILPSVNTRDQSFNEFINGKDGVVRHYLSQGTAGWRLDVADELDEGFIRNLRAAAKNAVPDSIIIGEVWEDASNKVSYGRRRSYFNGKELDSVMNYPYGNAIIGYILSCNSAFLFSTVKRIYAHYPKCVSDCNMNILGTHDTARALTRLSGIGEEGRSNEQLSVSRMPQDKRQLAVKRLKLAYFLLCVLPGVPCIYYGDEAGMEGYHDPFNRMPFPWNNIDKGLLSFYRRMGKIRRAEKIFAGGWLRLCEKMPQGVFALRRFDGKNEIFAAVNLSGSQVSFELSGFDMMRNKPVSGKRTISDMGFCLIKRKRSEADPECRMQKLPDVRI